MLKPTNRFRILLLSILFLVNYTFAQQYANVDAAVKNYPKTFASPNVLATQINKDFTTEEEKARAIFTWIALNVKYDLKFFNEQSGNPGVAFSFTSEEDRISKQQKYREELAKKTLRTKKGVCQDYVALFQILCDLTGVKCMEITGTSKTHPSHIGKLPKASDHAWNAIKLGDNWKFIDVTWASGGVNLESGKFIPEFNDAYFCTSPTVFFLNHFPDDKRFLMLDKTAEEFAALPLYYGDYLKSGYEITAPEQGIFSLSETAVIPFQILDLSSSDKLTYVLSAERKPHEIQLTRFENAVTFQIPLTKRNRGFLTIYVNNKSVVTYKLQP